MVNGQDVSMMTFSLLYTIILGLPFSNLHIVWLSRNLLLGLINFYCYYYYQGYFMLSVISNEPAIPWTWCQQPIKHLVGRVVMARTYLECNVFSTFLLMLFLHVILSYSSKMMLPAEKVELMKLFQMMTGVPFAVMGVNFSVVTLVLVFTT